MGHLKIEKILYDGDYYYFESPIFEDGINIIEGTNGSGKSTFSNLISFVLGNYVKEFDKRKKSKAHTQIVNDTNNYVLAIISIDEQRYKIKRFFNNNSVFIEEKDNITEYPIYRSSSDVEIFSDWLLNKLGFSIVEIYQGTAKSKLNFSDLFRLIYYDQKTVPEKIYKDSRNDRNFVSDSEFIRKVIFQMLMGHEFSEYYQLVGKLNQDKKKLNDLKIKENGFLEIASEFGFKELSAGTLGELEKEIEEVVLQLKRLEMYEEELVLAPENSIDSVEKVRQLKKRLVDIELSIEDIQNKINRVYKEINSILNIKKDIILEVTQIKKIILTHEELNLFSPDTCPYCLNKAERNKGHCICGKEIDENEYEKFFYSSDEYLTILKSKQKSIETLDLAVQSCEEELSELETEIVSLTKEKIELQNLVDEVKEDVERNTNFAEVKDVEYRKYSLKEKGNHLKQNYKAKKNFDDIQMNILSTKSDIATKNENLMKKSGEAAEEIKKQIIKFNEIYNNLMVDIKEDINKARISEDNYMPIINDGEYKEASVDVLIRLMYFITLLKLSLMDSKIPFPRFLLIDTPESLGIDKDDLEKAISKLLDNDKDMKTENGVADKFQIILTTGIKKYPEEFSIYKKGRSLNKQDRLLIKKN
ncbi:AAA family ATPase [Priestia aryabhattai]|uniref:AAA family ATPase n=1 Tax=Priestia aryabhattai TaxID=412384 RepID=UPI002E22ABD0|nr:AAA family ATPase [Priestia aryabhattai]MED4023649.1 AAA family ATPase [Priestia aryabhattai]